MNISNQIKIKNILLPQLREKNMSVTTSIYLNYAETMEPEEASLSLVSYSIDPNYN